MKFPGAYYLMLLYITVILKPLMPVISDTWSHQFNILEHEALVHARYGSHHLQKELAEQGSDDRTKNGTVQGFEDGVPLHLSAEEHDADFTLYKLSTSYPVFILNELLPVPASKQGPPPKFFQ